ncbi:uncharacterized protein LOC126382202 isoform X2 [Pectinophora gossypiella]|nr:uncharacterized protein LOC126382202 isoform X2 [Pectinophora gossypiella]
MNFLDHHRLCNLQLLVRNEGKIKSYESCCDIRAWSHNVRTRDIYLREWIKCDMPLCVVPCSTLIGFFRTMTCKRSGRATPRCHPDCKSKVILESITTSCDAIKECLKADESLEKYFMEANLETSHWPCERCLEALKSIKTFWRIMLERVFAINVTRNECFQDSSCCTTDSVRNMARIWKKDMIQQAMFVKTITPQIVCQNRARNCCKKQAIKKVSSCHISAPCSDGDAKPLLRKSSRITCCSNRHSSSHKRVTIDCSPSSSLCKTCQTPPRRLCRCISAKVRTADVGINCSDCGEVKAYRSSVECIKKNYDLQREEIEQLKKENCSLKCELQNIYKTCKWKAYYCTDSMKSEKGCTKGCTDIVPQPFDYCVDDNTTCTTCTSAKDADSELVITMKN